MAGNNHWKTLRGFEVAKHSEYVLLIISFVVD